MPNDDLHDRLHLSLLQAGDDEAAIESARDFVMQNQLAGMIIPPVFVGRMKGRGVTVGTVISFPLGISKSTVKAIEATVAIKDGADEVCIVPHLPNVIAGDFPAIKAELIDIARACRAGRRDVVITVMIETSMLMQSEASIVAGCRAIRESGCDGVQTGTGFSPTSVIAIQLLKKHGDGLQITAAGGVDDSASAKAMLEAGADRIVTNSPLAILRNPA